MAGMAANTGNSIGGKRARLIRKLSIDLTIMVTIGVVLALIGPFGSFETPLPGRLAAWVMFALVGYAIYSPMSWVVDKAHHALDLPRPGLWVAACLVATLPMTAVVWAFHYFPARSIPWPPFDQFMTQYFYVLVIGGGVTALFYMLESRKVADGDVAVASAPEAPLAEAADLQPSAPRFMDRLPPALGSDLIALEMEDHYVRAHTALGSELVLMRMRDAVAELDGAEGMQVHRSWWVARGGVEDVLREGRNIRLKLAGGLQAPVSRANVALLKGAGWI